MQEDLYAKIASNPIFFERNRVFRVYRGGRLFHDFFGDEAADSNLPEEWIASSVHAINKGGGPHDGVSQIKGTGVYLDELLERQGDRITGGGKDLGILVKVLDSAIRLPVQCHPDKAFSRRYFASEYGKAEMWVVLATREDAKVFFGFKRETSPEELSAAVEKSETDRSIMESLLNPVPARKGDLWFIPGGAAHAIGAGCLMLEIQEPTDFTIQPEAWCGDYHLSHQEKYLSLSKQTALSCFDYSVFGARALQAGQKTPAVISDARGVRSESLLGPGDTDCFSVLRHRIKSGRLEPLMSPAVYIITDGGGFLKSPGASRELTKGDYFLLPYSLRGQCTAESGGMMELIECRPPEKKRSKTGISNNAAERTV